MRHVAKLAKLFGWHVWARENFLLILVVLQLA
jgi:hypothetical protein